MVLGSMMEAEDLSREAIQAAEDAKKAQERLLILKKRFGMLKPSPSMEPTIETRGTDSIQGENDGDDEDGDEVRMGVDESVASNEIDNLFTPLTDAAPVQEIAAASRLQFSPSVSTPQSLSSGTDPPEQEFATQTPPAPLLQEEVYNMPPPKPPPVVLSPLKADNETPVSKAVSPHPVVVATIEETDTNVPQAEASSSTSETEQAVPLTGKMQMPEASTMEQAPCSPAQEAKARTTLPHGIAALPEANAAPITSSQRRSDSVVEAPSKSKPFLEISTAPEPQQQQQQQHVVRIGDAPGPAVTATQQQDNLQVPTTPRQPDEHRRQDSPRMRRMSAPLGRSPPPAYYSQRDAGEPLIGVTPAPAPPRVPQQQVETTTSAPFPEEPKNVAAPPKKSPSVFTFQTPTFQDAERLLDTLLGDSASMTSEPRESPGMSLHSLQNEESAQAPMQAALPEAVRSPTQHEEMQHQNNPHMYHRQAHPQMHSQVYSPMNNSSTYRPPPIQTQDPSTMAMPAMAHDGHHHHHQQQHRHHDEYYPMMMRPAEQFLSPRSLQPIDELEKRIAAIPETRDDFPTSPTSMEGSHFGSYYGDDVSVLTEFNYPKMSTTTSPRQQQQFQQTIAEEEEPLDDAPAARNLVKANSVEAAKPRDASSPPATPLYQLVERPGPRAPSPAHGSRSMSDQNSTGDVPRRRQPLDAPEIQIRPSGQQVRNVAAAPTRQHAGPQSDRVFLSNMPPEPQRKMDAPEVISLSGRSSSVNGDAASIRQKSRAAPVGYRAPYAFSPTQERIVHTEPYFHQQHRYTTTRSGAANVVSYHRENFGSDQSAASYHHPTRPRFSPTSSGVSVASQPQQYSPSGGASVSPSIGDNSIISVRTNTRGRKVVTKLVKVDEENETDPVVMFFDKINIDKCCGVEFDEQYAVVEEELPPEPLAPASVSRNAAIGKKVFNENNYADPFAGRHDDVSLCGGLL
eukprot:scaffold991_cov128-Cylindrotheca_fusiformis.AAC.21